MKKIIILFVLIANTAFAQDFLMQGWYWDYPKTIDGNNWADTLTDKAQELADAGFTYVWLPPLSRASFGSGSNGYDPQDLYDLGEYGGGATGFGTRIDVNEVIAEFESVGINAVADVVYNHRDGGKAEDNPAVEDYIETYWDTKVDEGYSPFPYDRFRCYVLLGGASDNGPGDYYFKVSSASGHTKFSNYEYNIYMQTNTIGWQSQTDQIESEPNGGGDCSESSNTISLGINVNAVVDDPTTCRTDEFHLTLSASDFDINGDTLYIYFGRRGSDYSDMRIYGVWYEPSGSVPDREIVDSVHYQTYTDFTSLPSGRGGMNYENFKPNSINSTKLDGDWDWPWFFYDYDQNVTLTKDSLFKWSEWLLSDVGIKGLRMDAVKHFPPEFVGDLFDYLNDQNVNPKLTVGEFYDGNASLLKGWTDAVYSYMDDDTKSEIVPRIFDFSLRQALKDACDSYGYDVRNVFTSGIVDGAYGNGLNTVTFLNNHDFRDAGQSVENDPILGYAYLLTNNKVGLPTVFYPDYFSVNGFPNGGLSHEIDELMEIHKKYIFGATSIDYLSRNGTPYFQDYSNGGFDYTTLIYQIMGTSSDRDMLVAINYAGDTDTLNVTHEINASNVTPGNIFVDLIENSQDPYAAVDLNGRVNIKLPPRSYSVWIKGVSVQVKIFLEGAYNSVTKEMSTALNDNLPLISPYPEDLRVVKDIDPSISDWILLELYDDLNNEPIVSRSVFVRKDGMLVLEDGSTTQIPLDAGDGNYYIVVRHRNHLAAASANKINISSSTPLYNFTIN